MIVARVALGGSVTHGITIAARLELRWGAGRVWLGDALPSCDARYLLVGLRAGSECALLAGWAARYAE